MLCKFLSSVLNFQAGKAPKVSKKNKGKQMYGPSFKKFSGRKFILYYETVPEVGRCST